MVIDVTMDQVKIACSDLNIIFESAWTNNAKVKAGIAAEKIGLKLGRCV
jgi:hypothetical protein